MPWAAPKHSDFKQASPFAHSSVKGYGRLTWAVLLPHASGVCSKRWSHRLGTGILIFHSSTPALRCSTCGYLLLCSFSILWTSCSKVGGPQSQEGLLKLAPLSHRSPWWLGNHDPPSLWFGVCRWIPKVIRERLSGKGFLVRVKMKVLDKNISGCCREILWLNDTRIEFPSALGWGCWCQYQLLSLS